METKDPVHAALSALWNVCHENPESGYYGSAYENLRLHLGLPVDWHERAMEEMAKPASQTLPSS